MLLILRCQLCLLLGMSLVFCEISDSCFYKIDHYKALFKNTFSLAVSLNCDMLQVISVETEKQLFYAYFL